MNSLSTPSLLSIKSPLLHSQYLKSLPSIQIKKTRKTKNFKCKAEFSQDAPFAVAIGSSILNSLVFPIPNGPEDDDGESTIDSTDARFAVMGIISFIPYFNWLSWVFAYLDTKSPRYVAYAIVYLAPYIRTNLSLSPEESWLPIASILLCIIHVQVEASIRNGDLQSFQLFKKSTTTSFKKSNQESEKLPSCQEHSRNKLRGLEVSEKQLDEQLEENADANDW
ncbi:hypothetical protein ACHQM5_011958 [Ranunculus cassubicifolius]